MPIENKIKLLFVEDIHLDVELACMAIKKDLIEYEKQVVETEGSFLKALKEYEPDLIISDYSLPQFDGLSALKLRNTISPHTPFILSTGSVNEEIAVECMKAGADDYVLKKNLARLGPAIRSVLKKKTMILEKEAAEQRLLESFEFNRSIIQTIPFGIDIVDETGTILFQSENMIALAGRNSIGEKCWDVYRDDRQQCSNCPLVQGVDIGVTKSYESHGILGKRIFDISHTGMIYQGKKAMLEIFQDVTDRKIMEEKVKKSEAHYKALTDLSPDGIAIADLKGRVGYVSRKIYDIFDVPDSQNLIGRSILDWVSPDYHEPVIKRISDLISGDNESEIREYLLLKNDGTPFWAELASSAIPSQDGRETELIVVCRDITERKKISEDLLRAKEKAEESDRLKTAFLQNISHEIRTPMNAIVGFASLLGETDIDTEARNSYIEVIMNSSNRLLVLLNDIIDIANIEAGTVKVDRQPVSVNSMLRTLYNQLGPKVKSKNLEFKLVCPLSDADAWITTDRVRLEQILLSLISNAIKFTDQGSITMGYLPGKNALEFYVSDTGIGISDEYKGKIFDRFFQIESPETKVFEGLGLGLTQARANVLLLGGTIHLDSKPGEGSRFYFSMPYDNSGKINRKELLSFAGMVNPPVKYN